MGILDKFKSSKGKKEHSGVKDLSENLLAAANALYGEGEYERAFEMYKLINEQDDNSDAQYNYATLFALGKGTQRDFRQASYWFHRAELNGDSNAERMRQKTMLDYVHEGFSEKTAKDLFEEMLDYCRYLYPREDSMLLAVRNLYALGGHHFNNKEYAQAAKLFRSAAEFGNDGYSQNYLAVLYNLGAGVEQDDLAALYWFDRAADNGIEEAVRDRNGIFLAYKSNNSEMEFAGIMEKLAEYCARGTGAIPQDADKVNYWRDRMNPDVAF